MNNYWPKGWKKALPNFLGEDFFTSFENMFEEEQHQDTSNPSSKKSSGIHVNIYESGHELLCIFKLPGLKLKEVDIDVHNDTIEITGSVFVNKGDFRPILEEIYEGPVHRKLKLPYQVRKDKVDASYKHGYLFVLLHRDLRAIDQKPKIIIEDLEAD
ncbi:Hsp20/alpha crystallin family protein [Cytobacillus sp. FJAT-54145]|uniref:Hsp20/alpha crystallin family protein n=1 Tax=Cytobacillus spartinae TaxID=3299023 RepID=A0ABW6KBP6_9BACI